VRAYPVTHVGLVRPQNEDALRVVKGLCNLYILADGMGGHLAGEVASQMTCDVLEEELRDCAVPVASRLQHAIEQANAMVFKKQMTSPDLHGMGTTLTVLWEGDDHVLIGQVGDSRAYLIRDGKLRQMTEDHSMVNELLRSGAITEEQARVHPYRNVITRAVGTDEALQPDVLQFLKMRGDIWLLCSDGLTDMVTDEEIAATLRDYAPAQAAERLLSLALASGGKDNVSIMLLEVDA